MRKFDPISGIDQKQNKTGLCCILVQSKSRISDFLFASWFSEVILLNLNFGASDRKHVLALSAKWALFAKKPRGQTFQLLQCQTQGGTAPLPPEINASAYTVIDGNAWLLVAG